MFSKKNTDNESPAEAVRIEAILTCVHVRGKHTLLNAWEVVLM